MKGIKAHILWECYFHMFCHIMVYIRLNFIQTYLTAKILTGHLKAIMQKKNNLCTMWHFSCAIDVGAREDIYSRSHLP